MSLPEPVRPAWRWTVERETDVPHVVAGCRQFCLDQGLSAVVAAHVATAASELANNLWMHTRQGGEIQLARLPGADLGVELRAEDHGPGIADVEAALREGYSTAGGMGCGLPGVRRLMDSFELHSRPGQGTQVVGRKWAHPPPRAERPAP